MSDYSIFDISASGMALERMRMQISSVNIANVNTTRTQNGDLFRPLAVMSSPKYSESFESYISDVQTPNDISMPVGVNIDGVEPLQLPPRIVYEPSHPDADDKGYVKYPNISPVSEMVNLINITRSYDANVRAFNATKKMFQVALDIGGR